VEDRPRAIPGVTTLDTFDTSGPKRAGNCGIPCFFWIEDSSLTYLSRSPGTCQVCAVSVFPGVRFSEGQIWSFYSAKGELRVMIFARVAVECINCVKG
jgi:hypothetical protein